MNEWQVEQRLNDLERQAKETREEVEKTDGCLLLMVGFALIIGVIAYVDFGSYQKALVEFIKASCHK